MSESDTLRLSTIIDEAHRLSDRVRDGTRTLDSLNNLGVALVATSLGVSLGTDRRVVILVAPVAGLLLVVHAVQTFTEIAMMAGHRRYLEEYLESQFRAAVLCHESTVGQERSASFDLRLKQVLYISVLLVVAIVSGILAYQDLDLWIFVAYVVFAGAALLTLGVSVRAMLSAESDGYWAVKRFYELIRDG